VLRLYNKERSQSDFIEASLPRELFELDEELEGIDQLLDEGGFLEIFLQEHQTGQGRPTVPVESYLRMMYLKYRHELGYKSLVLEISDSIKWRTFCRFKLSDPVPASSTLKESTQRYGEERVREIYDLVLEKAREKKILRRLRRQRRRMGSPEETHVRLPDDNPWPERFKSLQNTVKSLQAAGSKAVRGFKNRSGDRREKVSDGKEEL